MPGGVECRIRRVSQIPLPEHPQKTTGESHTRGWYQGAQDGQELTELVEELRQDRKVVEGWSPYREICRP